jgi:hypothetical protein
MEDGGWNSRDACLFRFDPASSILYLLVTTLLTVAAIDAWARLRIGLSRRTVPLPITTLGREPRDV